MLFFDKLWSIFSGGFYIMKRVLGLFLGFIFIQQSYGAMDVSKSESDEGMKISIEQWLLNQDTVQMYLAPGDGELLLEPWNVQADLKKKGINVLSSYIGYDGLRYGLEGREDVNSPTINIVSVPVEFYEQIKELGFRLCKELQEEGGQCHALSYTEFMTGKSPFVTSVYKTAGEKQCHPGSGVAVHDMEQELVEAEIMVYQGYKANDGMRHNLSCEENTADINVYVIEMSRLAEVMSMGYRECAYLEMVGGGCYPLPLSKD